ncbi:MAG: hypothetical protein K8S87_02445, partial [Planctomycetes bacterium]|nr:hypothetical protein [Planctomycetota bacterium]
AGLFFHFLTLSLTVLTFSFGISSAISTMLKVYHNVLGISNVLSLPTILLFAGVGFVIGGNFWRKSKQHSFSVITISILILLLTNLLLLFIPKTLELTTISGIQKFGIDSESVFAMLFSSIPFILIFAVMLGLFTSLMIPALSLVDIWHRERLRRKNHFTTPPKVRRWLAIWAPFVIFLMILGYFIEFMFSGNINVETVDAARSGFLVSMIFLGISGIACLIYMFYRPAKVNIYEHSGFDVTTIGYKLFGWRSRFLSYSAGLIGIMGITAFITVFGTQNSFLAKILPDASSNIVLGILIFLILGVFVGIIGLRLWNNIKVLLYSILLLLILIFIAISLFDFMGINRSVIFSGTPLPAVIFFFVGVLLSVLVRTTRVFFDAEVFKEGKLISFALGIGIILGSIVSIALIAGFDSPFVIIHHGFNFFVSCLIVSVVIAPTGSWKVRAEILNLGETFFENDRQSKNSLIVAILWGIGLASVVVGWNSLVEMQKLDDYQFVNNNAVKITESTDESTTFEINGQEATFNKNAQDYSIISAHLGMLGLALPEKNHAAFFTNNLGIIKDLEDYKLMKSMLVNPFAYTVNSDLYTISHNPYLWVQMQNYDYTNYSAYIHFDINDETAEFILKPAFLGVLSQISTERYKTKMISFNLNLKKLAPQKFVNAVNLIQRNFKDLHAYYLPDMLILLNFEPKINAENASKEINLCKIQFPSKPENMLKELEFWEVKLKEIEAPTKFEKKEAYKINNTLILENFTLKDSLPYYVLQALNYFAQDTLEQARTSILSARKRHNELAFHEESLKNVTKHPVRDIYYEVQFKIWYINALEAMREANEAKEGHVRKNRLNDAKIWAQKATDIKPEYVSAWIICYKAAKELGSRDLQYFENKIKELNPKKFAEMNREEFADK